MNRRTPRATPVAPAPSRPGAALPSTDPGRMQLTAPIVIVAPDGEHELALGSLVIGRQPGSDITLDDGLVSRQHARLRALPDGTIVVEDLHSTNGVYVNGTRVSRSVQKLCEGDRLLVGTIELGVFQGRSHAPPRPREALPPMAHAPSSRRLRIPKSDNLPVTERADALGVMSRLAERLAASGNTIEAVRVLSAHLHKVLLGASAGLPVPEPLLDQATHSALRLFEWSGNAAWIDYVLELHLALALVPREPSFSALRNALAAPGVAFDPRLFRYYLEALQAQSAQLAEPERARLAELVQLTAR